MSDLHSDVMQSIRNKRNAECNSNCKVCLDYTAKCKAEQAIVPDAQVTNPYAPYYNGDALANANAKPKQPKYTIYVNHNTKWYHWPLVLMCKLYRTQGFSLSDEPDYIVNVYLKGK